MSLLSSASTSNWFSVDSGGGGFSGGGDGGFSGGGGGGGGVLRWRWWWEVFQWVVVGGGSPVDSHLVPCHNITLLPLPPVLSLGLLFVDLHIQVTTTHVL